MPARLAKTVMVLSLALFALLVAFTNVADYDANWQFVQHVLSMDTTFQNPAIMDRAVTAPGLQRAAYALIIAGEGVTGVIFLVAGARMLMALAAPGAFARAKRLVHLGAAAGFLVWFTGFMVVGGEWFAMWQSDTWNGQDAAFSFYVTILLVTLYVMQPDGD